MTKGKPKRKKTSGKTGNTNAVRHGRYVRRYDGRTWQGKLQQQIQADLTTALGGDPSPQEVLIIRRVAVKWVRCACLEGEILRDEAVSLETKKRYLGWSHQLRNDLGTLGMDRREPVVDLNDFLEGKS